MLGLNHRSNMGAYNWIRVEAKCPNCGRQSLIQCQTHIASDYDGDAAGRFHDRNYQLGGRMAWWPEADVRFSSWSGDGAQGSGGVLAEACYSKCTNCAAALCAVIRFQELAPQELLELCLESDWPESYPR